MLKNYADKHKTLANAKSLIVKNAVAAIESSIQLESFNADENTIIEYRGMKMTVS